MARSAPSSLSIPAFAGAVAALAAVWTATDVRPGNAAERGITNQFSHNVINAEIFDKNDDDDKKKKKKKRKTRTRGGSFY